ncbi:MAG TPA: YihY/virulence factor BrkB family protein, partial [Candidatus Caenarcaniphilales bacterium]
DQIIRRVASQSGDFETGLLEVWQLFSWPLALGMIAIAAAFIYRYGPSHWRSGTPILPGAILAALLWATVSGLFRLYVSRFGNYNQAYGAVGAVIVLLLWLYLSALSLLIGAQLNVTIGASMGLSKGKRTSTPP